MSESMAFIGGVAVAGLAALVLLNRRGCRSWAGGSRIAQRNKYPPTT